MMTDQPNQPFVPHKPEKTLQIEVTEKEAKLIEILRKYSFGKFTVSKINNLLIRIEIRENVLIK